MYMGINSLRKIVKIKQMLSDPRKIAVFIIDTLIYITCLSFVIGTFAIGLYYTYIEIMENIILKCYVIGVLVMVSLGLSIKYINRYNKKYSINDSNSSKGQNDFLFESDIRREERRYANRRNVEQ
jgi:hypothetical protein